MRLAVYFVPADGSPLARFGNAVLGRDAIGRTVSVRAPLPRAPGAWTRRPARYGFHATLKAPFELAAGATEADLADACGALAARHSSVPMPRLAPAALDGFTALLLPEPLAGVEALAAGCVQELDRFRAPLDAIALARRRPERLRPAARARLERWGYPHVLDGFRLHMTLSDTLEATSEVEAWRKALARHYRATVGGSAVLDRLALCREAAPDGLFVRVAEFPLR